jgi:hypothetical protein
MAKHSDHLTEMTILFPEMLFMVARLVALHTHEFFLDMGIHNLAL